MAHVSPGNLPGEPTSFVGREGEVAEVVRLLAQERLVTLTGVGGVGKTRLAVRAAGRARSVGADGVWLVELSPLRDPDLLAHTVSATIGIEDQTTRPQIEVLVDFLAAKEVLVVLDTCEHQVEACAKLAGLLLDAAPGLRLLATSRVPLGAACERVLTVGPLPTGAAEPARNPAVRLFMDRAAAVVPDLTPGPEVIRLCRRLDGIPLALELAAVRLREFSVPDITERLTDRFRLLERPGSPGLPRHQTMRTAIGWSHELCLPLERLLWARLSVFAGSFDIEAVRAVCCAGRLASDQVEDLLAGLVDRSIVVREGARYRLLDTLREYGAEWLARLGEEPEVRVRHRDHYREVARAFDAGWWGPDQLAWQARLGHDHANLRLAIEFCLSRPEERPAGLEMAGLLIFYWFPCGMMKEGRRYLERALALCPEPSSARTRGLWSCAWLAGLQGEPDVTARYAIECRAQARAQADDFSLAWGVGMDGVLGVLLGDHTMAVTMAREAIDLFARSGDRGIGEAYMQLAVGVGLLGAGKYDEALEVLDAVRERCVQRGDLWARSYAELFRGMGELAMGRPEAAAASARTAGRVKWSLRDRLGTAEAIDLLAEAVGATGEAARAARLLGIAETVWRSIGIPQAGIPMLIGPRLACEESARERIGDRAYESAHADGRAQELASGVAEALAMPVDSSP
ncbi:ATP-binding protein [Spirillospora sp. NPDC048911]|uniref:ATP-binding protein n=1 Tax=Spirillospora sp. NPDC048911 TaxID=3364527 RepID=UPI0037219D30